MQGLIDQFGPELLQRYDLVLRLLLAAALGGMIGLEREHSGKPAGFRTNMLICLGAALITEVSFNVAAAAGGAGADPARIAAQIVSGIGFLGAGSILHSRGSVTGLTTAATLWVVAAIGMAVGAHAYLAAVLVTALVMLALMLLGRVEDHLIPRRPSEREVHIMFTAGETNIEQVESTLTALGYMVDTMSVEKRDHTISARFHLRGSGEKWERAVHDVLGINGVSKIDLS